jgi:predicted P-loop ATPase/GTPase
MTSSPLIESTLVELLPSAVQVTYTLSRPLLPLDVDRVGYWVSTFNAAGDEGKQWGVRIADGEESTAYVFEFGSATQANYHSSSITVDGRSLVVLYNDASLTPDNAARISATSTVGSSDAQSDLPVTLLT